MFSETTMPRAERFRYLDTAHEHIKVVDSKGSEFGGLGSGARTGCDHVIIYRSVLSCGAVKYINGV